MWNDIGQERGSKKGKEKKTASVVEDKASGNGNGNGRRVAVSSRICRIDTDRETGSVTSRQEHLVSAGRGQSIEVLIVFYVCVCVCVSVMCV